MIMLQTARNKWWATNYFLLCQESHLNCHQPCGLHYSYMGPDNKGTEKSITSSVWMCSNLSASHCLIFLSFPAVKKRWVLGTNWRNMTLETTHRQENKTEIIECDDQWENRWTLRWMSSWCEVTVCVNHSKWGQSWKPDSVQSYVSSSYLIKID